MKFDLKKLKDKLIPPCSINGDTQCYFCKKKFPKEIYRYSVFGRLDGAKVPLCPPCWKINLYVGSLIVIFAAVLWIWWYRSSYPLGVEGWVYGFAILLVIALIPYYIKKHPKSPDFGGIYIICFCGLPYTKDGSGGR